MQKISKSNTKSNTIVLPNGCSCTEMRVTPSNWLTSAASCLGDWVICYTFFDPEFEKGKRMQIRGMNHTKDLYMRRLLCKEVMRDELDNLQKGYNPFKGVTLGGYSSDLNPNTSFVQALWIVLGKLKVEPSYLVNIKSVVRGVEKSAKQLGIYNMPLKDVSRRYYKRIFEQCYKNNSRFTTSTQNRYRKSLMLLYRELIELEAVEINPMRDIKKEREIRKERVMPTAEERNKIDNFLKEKYYYFWRLVNVFFHSGARETEIMRVQRKHVDITNQRCKYLVKKGIEIREVYRPIIDSALPLWLEVLNECRSESDYLFAKGLKPGLLPIAAKQLSRRWNVHVKGFNKDGSVKAGKLGINVDFYTLKHLNTTEVMDELDQTYNYKAENDVKQLTGHTSTAMVIGIYDKNNKTRQDDKLKKVSNSFASK